MKVKTSPGITNKCIFKNMDLLDELLSTIPNAQRTTEVLNNLHIMIERFTQMRQLFSVFNQFFSIFHFYQIN